MAKKKKAPFLSRFYKLSRFKQGLIAVVLIFGLTGGIFAAKSTFALASSCSTVKHTGTIPQAGSVRCFSGTGAYRVRVWCSLYDNGGGIIRSGPWTGIGGLSKATCTSQHPLVYKITIEKVG